MHNPPDLVSSSRPMHAESKPVPVESPEPQQASILIVDADAADAQSLASILSQRGFGVRTAADGPGALTSIHESRPQLMFVAADLGGLSGEELQAALNIDRRTAGIPVLLMRPRGDLTCRVPGADAPTLDFVWKPFDEDEVLARTASQIELAGLRDRHKEQTRLLTMAMKRLTAAVQADEMRSRQLHDSKGRFKTLLDNLPGLAYRCKNDADWTMEFLSDGCVDVTGYAPSDLLFNNVLSYADLIHPEDVQFVSADVQAALAKRGPFEIEYRILHKDGTVRWVWERGRGVFRPDGELDCLDGLIVDVTERKQALELLARQMSQLESTMFGTVKAIAAITELRDPYTAGHERQVAAVARAIGAELGLPTQHCHGLEVIGLMHDIGKVAIPAQILSKPSALTALEFEMIKTHPQAGCDILKGLEFPWPVAQTILQHHERLDGSGYPAGLKDGEILFEARIIAVADVVAAMSAHRPYRPTLGVAAALEEITNHGRARYDQQVARACVRVFRERGFRLPK